MVCQGATVRPEPSAPYPEYSEPQEPSTVPITARGLHSECSICLDKQVSVQFQLVKNILIHLKMKVYNKCFVYISLIRHC